MDRTSEQETHSPNTENCPERSIFSSKVISKRTLRERTRFLLASRILLYKLVLLSEAKNTASSHQNILKGADTTIDSVVYTRWTGIYRGRARGLKTRHSGSDRARGDIVISFKNPRSLIKAVRVGYATHTIYQCCGGILPPQSSLNLLAWECVQKGASASQC